MHGLGVCGFLLYPDLYKVIRHGRDGGRALYSWFSPGWSYNQGHDGGASAMEVILEKDSRAFILKKTIEVGKGEIYSIDRKGSIQLTFIILEAERKSEDLRFEYSKSNKLYIKGYVISDSLC